MIFLIIKINSRISGRSRQKDIIRRFMDDTMDYLIEYLKRKAPEP